MAPSGGRPLNDPFTGAVLCGGASTRMGRDKATLEIDGFAMAARVAGALREAGAAEVLAVGGDAASLEPLGLAFVADDEPGEGPFPATLTALRAASFPTVVVLSCDLVHPSARAVDVVVARLRAAAPEIVGAVPLVGGQEQWTHAAWRRSALEPLLAARRDGARSLKRAAALVPLLLVGELSSDDVADADHPRDLPGAR